MKTYSQLLQKCSVVTVLVCSSRFSTAESTRPWRNRN